MAGNQSYLFIVFTLVGIIIGIIFDIFRILRKCIKTIDIIIYLEDILFWVITGIIIIFSMYKFCDGQLRFFMIIGIVMGALTYLLTISKYVIQTSLFIINIVRNILIYPIKLISKIIKKLIFSPIIFICINLRKKFVKKDEKNRGFFREKEKYNNI